MREFDYNAVSRKLLINEIVNMIGAMREYV